MFPFPSEEISVNERRLAVKKERLKEIEQIDTLRKELHQQLTEKETEIISLIAEGLSNREIAGSLYLSEGTVRNAISVIMDKLDLKRRTQIAIFYYKNVQE